LTVYRKLLLFNLCESWIVKDLVLDVVGVHKCFDTLIWHCAIHSCFVNLMHSAVVQVKCLQHFSY